MPEYTKLEVKMAHLEAQIKHEVIPSLKRIEESIDNAFVKIKKNNSRIDGLEKWKQGLITKAETSAYLGKRVWLLTCGVVGGVVSIINLACTIYERLK